MTPQEYMTVIIAVSTLLVSVATFFIGCCFTAKKTEGEAARALRSDLGYIKSSLDDIKRKQEQQEANHIEMMSRLATVEASAKQAHRRLDKHDKEIGAIWE